MNRHRRRGLRAIATASIATASITAVASLIAPSFEATASASTVPAAAPGAAVRGVAVRVHEKRKLKMVKVRKLSRRQLSKEFAKEMLAKRGWGTSQFQCLEKLWHRESGWNHTASNGHSGAYGIPQALPGGKMSSAGRDWRTNPETQIKWGVGYIKGRYGTPCGAWGHFQSSGWY